MLEKSNIVRELKKTLGKSPEKAERFSLSDELEVDFLQFNDRPYQGVSSIITNGVNRYCESNQLEFVITFDSTSIDKDTDLNALLATYLQLHYIEYHKEISAGDYFRVPGMLLRDYNYIGIYTADPVYFPDDTFSGLSDVKFLWLIPIYQNEYEFLDKFGAGGFEDYLEANDPDMTIFKRQPLALR